MSDILVSYEVSASNGAIIMLLDDPTFTRAETVMVDMQSGEVSVLLQQKLHSVGSAPPDILKAFRENSRNVTLKSTRVDGTELKLLSTVVLKH